MGIPGAANPLLLASAGSSYQIERSLRFNSADSAYLSRTPASAGNRKTWTWAGWVKRSKPGNDDRLLIAAINYFQFSDNVVDALTFGSFNGSTHDFRITTSRLFRDYSAWYHIVLAFDTTQGTAANRISLYVNGLQETSFSTSSYPNQNTDWPINNNVHHSVMGVATGGGSHGNGYLADIHFIDGQALTPSSFGETDGNGVWQPKAYTGSYGTNGFHLPFSDNSTAAALGTDTSGNGNTWTPNNLSVTAGAGNDSLVDTPTSYGTDTGIGGEVRGNYATLNPLDSSSTTTLSNGNLDLTTTVNAWRSSRSTIGMTSGKWYFEAVLVGSAVVNAPEVGIMKSSATLENFIGADANGWGYSANGSKYNNNTAAAYGATFGEADVIGCTFDAGSGTLSFFKNGISQGEAFSGLTSGPYFFAVDARSQFRSANFGQRPFAYTAPSGFKALCTQNLPEGTITTSGTFTGNAATNGPFVYLNGVPTAMTINGNAVTFATHADKLSNGFKLRTNSGSYNTSGSNTYSVSTTGSKFKYARAQPNP